MKHIFLLSCLVFVNSLSSIAQSASEEKVWSRVQALTKAVFEARDSIALKEMVSDHVTYGHSGGNIEDKATMVTMAATSTTTYRNVQFEKVAIDVNRRTAVVRHNLRAGSVDAAGVQTPLTLSILQVWKKEHGKWKLWARQAVKIPAKT
jgi:ketosteroid isomerase-like protein